MKRMISVWVPMLLIAAASVIFLTKCYKFDKKLREPGGKTALAAATEMVGFLPKLADRQYFARLGFKTLEEVGQVSLGRPIPYAYLGCDRIQSYDTSKGDDLRPLLFGHQLLFPLMVGDQVRSAFVVDSFPDEKRRKGLDWTVVEFGKAAFIVAVDSLIKKLSGSPGNPDSRFSLVGIPAMQISYLAFPGGNGTFLHPIDTGVACWPAPEGESARVEAVLSGLAGCKELAAACSEPVSYAPVNPILKRTTGETAGDTSTLKRGPAAK